MVRLRVLTAGDWPLWREVRLAALTESPQAFKARLEDWPHGGEDQWRARLEAPGTYNLVALLDGRAAGMARGVPAGGGACELRSVWVGPEARGRGVGDLLIANVEAWARSSGAGTLSLAVMPGNEPATRLYRRNGFVASGELGDQVAADGTRESVMVKLLR